MHKETTSSTSKTATVVKEDNSWMVTAKGERDICMTLATDPTGDVEPRLLYLCFEAPAPRDAFMLAYSPL